MLAGAALIIVACSVALAVGLRKGPPQTAPLAEHKPENTTPTPAIQPLRPSSTPNAVPAAQPQEKAPEEKQAASAPNSDPEAEAARAFEEVR
jgi:hypothetical protein